MQSHLFLVSISHIFLSGKQKRKQKQKIMKNTQPAQKYETLPRFLLHLLSHINPMALQERHNVDQNEVEWDSLVLR
jgi:hypothetical protein